VIYQVQYHLTARVGDLIELETPTGRYRLDQPCAIRIAERIRISGVGAHLDSNDLRDASECNSDDQFAALINYCVEELAILRPSGRWQRPTSVVFLSDPTLSISRDYLIALGLALDQDVCPNNALQLVVRLGSNQTLTAPRMVHSPKHPGYELRGALTEDMLRFDPLVSPSWMTPCADCCKAMASVAAGPCPRPDALSGADPSLIVAHHLRRLFGLDGPKHVDVLRMGFVYDLSQFSMRAFTPVSINNCRCGVAG
jgi:hypothetical protein